MRDFAQSIVETGRHPLPVLDGRRRVRKANAAFYRTFKTAETETEGRLAFELGGGQWDIPRLRALLEEVVRDGGAFKDVEVRHDFPLVSDKVMVLDAQRVVHRHGGRVWAEGVPGHGATIHFTLPREESP